MTAHVHLRPKNKKEEIKAVVKSWENAYEKKYWAQQKNPKITEAVGLFALKESQMTAANTFDKQNIDDILEIAEQQQKRSQEIEEEARKLHPFGGGREWKNFEKRMRAASLHIVADERALQAYGRGTNEDKRKLLEEYSWISQENAFTALQNGSGILGAYGAMQLMLANNYPESREGRVKGEKIHMLKKAKKIQTQAPKKGVGVSSLKEQAKRRREKQKDALKAQQEKQKKIQQKTTITQKEKKKKGGVMSFVPKVIGGGAGAGLLLSMFA